MLLAPDVARFIAWFAAFQQRVEVVVKNLLAASHASVAVWRSPADEASYRLELGEAVELEWGQWLDASAHPELHGMRHALRRSLAQLEHERPIRALANELRDAIEQLPEQVTLAPGPGELDSSAELPLRRYFALELGARIAPAFELLERGVEHALQDIGERIEAVERVLDYYTLAIERSAAELEASEAEEFARTGLTRVQSLIEQLHRGRASWARRTIAEFVESSSAALEDASAPLRAHRLAEVQRRLAEHERSAAGRSGIIERAWFGLRQTYARALPVVRNAAIELRTLFVESEARSLDSLLPGDPAELGRELPLSYRRLFSALPLEISDLFIPRPAFEQACVAAIESWLRGTPNAIVVHGDRGAGKRSAINHVLARVRSQAALEVRWIRLGPKLRDEPAVARVLGRALGLGPDASRFAELREPALDGRHRVIVVESCERLLAPSAAGVARLVDFFALVGRSSVSTLWILLLSTPAATLALDRLGLGDRVATVLPIEAMTPVELRSLLEARHRLSGFELEFDEPGVHVLEHLAHPLARLRSRAPIDTFHARLWQASAGNPRQAMFHWLACARPHAREGRIVMAPLPSRSARRLASLPLSQRLLLAQLAQHGSLTSDELMLALSASRERVEGDLAVLWAKGYLGPSPEHELHWSLQTTTAHPLLLELRSNNMI